MDGLGAYHVRRNAELLTLRNQHYPGNMCAGGMTVLPVSVFAKQRLTLEL